MDDGQEERESNPVISRVRTEFNDWCTICKDWVGPAWKLTWASGHQEIRCGIHGGANL